MKLLKYFIILLICISCNVSKKQNTLDLTKILKNLDKRESFFQTYDFKTLGSRLIIFSVFDECGEWGGHKESIDIFAKNDNEFYAKFTRHSVDCDKIEELYGKPEFQKLDFEKEIYLDKNKQKAISNYLKKLMVNKFTEKFPGNSGQTFGAKKSDSTFYISIYDNNPNNLKNYNILLSALKIVNVKIEKK